jgi:hypothetical protein
MNSWDLFNFNKVNEEKIANAIAAGKKPTISSPKELEVYLKYKIGDAEFAQIFVQTLEKLGSNGAVEIKQGGNGNPYQLEYVPSELRKTMTKKEIKKHINEITERLEKDKSLSEDEIEKLQNEISQLVNCHTIIWVNSSTQDAFAKKEQLFANAVCAVKEAFQK